MGDAPFPYGTTFETLSDATIDFDHMDDLLLGECWLETTDCSDLFQQGAGTSAELRDSSSLSLSEINKSSSIQNLMQNIEQDDLARSVWTSNPPPVLAQTDSLFRMQLCDRKTVETDSDQLESYQASEHRRLDEYEMIGPSSNPGPLSSVKERLIQALRYIKESTKGGDVLVQIWVPIKEGGRHFLTTFGQPFSLDPSCQRLWNYRNVSVKYQFPAEEDSKENVGLPGRVFLEMLPEWTPDVRYFSSDEYPRIDHARRNDVHGTLALPVFERGRQACLGVVEVVLTTQKLNYHFELESICNALQAVNLRSSEVASVPRLMASNNSYQVALPEILEVLRAVCETHGLPLAQTWVPCMQQGKKGSRHSDENYINCVSTLDIACYVKDPHMWDFHEACSEHHLFRGQGVTGKAFTTNQPCFSSDITTFCKTKYPLSHYAQIFGLRAAVAIRLRSIYTGSADYVLEFFLPLECLDKEEQKMMLNSLSMFIKQVCQCLRVVTDEELDGESVSIIPSGEVTGYSASDHKSSLEGKQLSYIQAQLKGKLPILLPSQPLDCQEERDGLYVRSHWDQAEGVKHTEEIFMEFKSHQDSVKEGVTNGDSSFGKHSVSNSGKVTVKRHTKREKNITLQVLRQYFAGSLKDAAKSIGVCPTTLKRICRQHGITRWPSRKIKKVGHSLKKLQVVIDSVQGVDGTFQLSSFYANFPHAYGSDLMSPKPSGSSAVSTPKKTADHPLSSNLHSEGVFSIHAASSKSPSSSCSQTSSSSLCCSTGSKKHGNACQLKVSEDPSMAEKECGALKRAYSEAILNELTKDEEKPPARSLSHISLNEHPSLDTSLFPMVNNRFHIPRDGNCFRVKVMYGDEKVRFSMHPSWGLQDLREEVANRFNIDDVNVFDLKYLDDDSEWVLLTCDEDLQECRDIYKLSGGCAIKLSVHRATRSTTKNCLSGDGT